MTRKKCFVTAWLRVIGRCAYCGRRMDMTEEQVRTRRPNCMGETNRTWTVEHVIPKSAHGSHRSDNLVVCCDACNFGRKAKPLSMIRPLWIERAGLAVLNDLNFEQPVKWLKPEMQAEIARIFAESR